MCKQLSHLIRPRKQVDNHVIEPEADHAGNEGQEGDNKEEGDAEHSTVNPIVKDPPRSFVPKAPYSERL